MLARLSSAFHRLSSRTWLILLAFAVEVFFFSTLAPRMQALIPTGPLDLKFFYTPGQAYSLVESYGEAGRAAYRLFDLTADIVHPIAYTLFFGLLLSVLFQRAFPANSPFQKYNVAPAISWFFDMIENIGVVTMLSIFPSRPALVAWIAALATSLKWTFFLVTIGLLLFSLARAAMNGFKKQA